MKRTMIIFNPAAGHAGALEHGLTAAAEVWRAHGWQVKLHPTHAPGDATRLARAAARQAYDLVAAAGGDGTINEVVNGLAGTETAMAPLPLGTVNVWARELGLPLQPPAAARAMLEWQTRQIDLGRAGGHYFLLMAGIGLDAAITADVHSHTKRRLGVLAYVLSAVDHLTRTRGTRTRLLLDGRLIKGRVLLVVLGNSQLYGGIFKITHRATIDDGLLDVCVIRGDNFFSALVHLVAILLRRYNHFPEIEYYRARRVKVTARTTLPVQVDGDTITHTPITVEAVPGALRALMPVRLPHNLVRHQAPPLHAPTHLAAEPQRKNPESAS